MASFKRILPLLNRVVIKKIEASKQSAAGIILPDTSERELTTGKVIATGPGQTAGDEMRKCLVEEGQTVILPMYGGQTVWLDKEKYYIYKDTEIVSILKD